MICRVKITFFFHNSTDTFEFNYTDKIRNAMVPRCTETYSTHLEKKEKKRKKEKKERENASSLHVSVSLTGLVFLFPHPASRVFSKIIQWALFM